MSGGSFTGRVHAIELGQRAASASGSNPAAEAIRPSSSTAFAMRISTSLSGFGISSHHRWSATVRPRVAIVSFSKRPPPWTITRWLAVTRSRSYVPPTIDRRSTNTAAPAAIRPGSPSLNASTTRDISEARIVLEPPLPGAGRDVVEGEPGAVEVVVVEHDELVDATVTIDAVIGEERQLVTGAVQVPAGQRHPLPARLDQLGPGERGVVPQDEHHLVGGVTLDTADPGGDAGRP